MIRESHEPFFNSIGQNQTFPATAGNVRSFQNRSFRATKTDIASPMTGMRSTPAAPDESPMSPFIADAVEKLVGLDLKRDLETKP